MKNQHFSVRQLCNFFSLQSLPNIRARIASALFPHPDRWVPLVRCCVSIFPSTHHGCVSRSSNIARRRGGRGKRRRHGGENHEEGAPAGSPLVFARPRWSSRPRLCGGVGARTRAVEAEHACAHKTVMEVVLVPVWWRWRSTCRRRGKGWCAGRGTRGCAGQ